MSGRDFISKPRDVVTLSDNILFIMMRTTAGRPNTAKKMLSPKGNLASPKRVKTKTEGQDLDVNQLCDAMYFFFELVNKQSVSRRNVRLRASMLRRRRSSEKSSP